MLPDNTAIVIPRLFCRDPERAIAFCTAVFDAVDLGSRTGADGRVVHALLRIGPAMLMIDAEWPTLPSRAPPEDGSSPVVIFIYVHDVDAALRRAVANGARTLLPAQNQFWGDRTAWILDREGHVWTIATRIEVTTDAQRTERWTKLTQPES